MKRKKRRKCRILQDGSLVYYTTPGREQYNLHSFGEFSEELPDPDEQEEVDER